MIKLKHVFFIIPDTKVELLPVVSKLEIRFQEFIEDKLA